MHCRRFLPSLFPLPFFLLLLVIVRIPQSLGNPDGYSACRDPRFECGGISIGYPFSGDGIPPGCGHPGLQLYCENNIVTIEILDVRYQVLHIYEEKQILRIARKDFMTDFCHPQFESSALDSSLFAKTRDCVDVTLLYDCPSVIPSNIGRYTCNKDSGSRKDVSIILLPAVDPGECASNITVPIPQTSLQGIGNNSSRLEEALKGGFEVQWKLDSKGCQKCRDTGGTCFFDLQNQPNCYCPNDTGLSLKECPFPNPSQANTDEQDEKKPDVSLITGFGIAGAVIAGILLGMGFLCLKQRKENSVHLRLPMNHNGSIEAFIKKYGCLAPKRYSYIDIKKMTNKFKDKLGQGGYGSVYKGKLPDGRLVAVKVLSESKGNGEEFMNEVASISRTSHVNIVTLLGFCYEISKRALVYEFMPHGSLDKFIYNQGSMNQPRQLEWKTLYDIALGIARGLEYLHQGCNTRILHFDIKPHNILLDESFGPKISDFGLSKLCERKDSIISMTGARGTAGYIAPEVFCRNFGGVSHKSDVYSYGMMVLEMVGGRKNIDVEVSQTSEIYFPSWVYKHLDQPIDLSLDGVTGEEEEEITRKLIVVSLWCIQTSPSDWPSMTKVLEMLTGSLQSLAIPPRPFVTSPVRLPKASSTTSSLTLA
ncbi:PREDICTED: LEAF RUST 10 DISEASE-RESISTANCE LOCUS RECEPTOR-LIKE PROTEIN KINASE-like 2.4 isoform X3 [Theobroma cacao]|uniref:non-specific serine/threonine protein kinase n=1 Tax=Theobroma cacao TaxID=3641 RepID=A0AB32W9Y7_THECC|nr:PREDICTED: LEAF RUST 10 DISEASE-RESISTANCE LOCUS RECEPTOR-LIKE PROTEIN KINASE-like 2.4 isoform X3 [Theobroma cacao]